MLYLHEYISNSYFGLGYSPKVLIPWSQGKVLLHMRLRSRGLGAPVIIVQPAKRAVNGQLLTSASSSSSAYLEAMFSAISLICMRNSPEMA